MIVTRRDFLKATGLLSAAAIMHAMPSIAAGSRTALNPDTLAKFVDPLPIPPIAHSLETRPAPDGTHEQVPYYRVSMREFERQVHRDLPATRLWGYDSSFPGPTFETRSGRGLLIEWRNDLPRTHFLPIDHHLHGAERSNPEVRAVVHVHGAKVPAHSDGYPEDWYEPGKSALYHYPNQQDAAMLWYHDHAMGINRLNIFAGLMGIYLVRDDFEDSLHLPRGEYEVPLVICDRMFDTAGQLYYPVSDKADGPWIPEFFGDTILINGKILPYLEVEPRKYRFRLLNASNARAFYLSLSNGAPLAQIGTDQGLLAAPVSMQKLQISPAERADLIVDFAPASRRANRPVGQGDAVDAIPRVKRSRRPDRAARDDPSRAEDCRSRPRSRRGCSRWTSTTTMVAESMLMLLNGTRWHMPVTENPELDSVEIWNLINLTDDAHPIHLHLVRFQILDRRRFDRFSLSVEEDPSLHRQGDAAGR